MTRTALNKKANKKMLEYCMDHEISSCEMRLEGCLGTQYLGFAHKMKRRDYYGLPDEMLWDRSQWLLACVHCHQKQEFNKELTSKLFGGT